MHQTSTRCPVETCSSFIRSSHQHSGGGYRLWLMSPCTNHSICFTVLYFNRYLHPPCLSLLSCTSPHLRLLGSFTGRGTSEQGQPHSSPEALVLRHKGEVHTGVPSLKMGERWNMVDLGTRRLIIPLLHLRVRLEMAGGLRHLTSPSGFFSFTLFLALSYCFHTLFHAHFDIHTLPLSLLFFLFVVVSLCFFLGFGVLGRGSVVCFVLWCLLRGLGFVDGGLGLLFPFLVRVGWVGCLFCAYVFFSSPLCPCCSSGGGLSTRISFPMSRTHETGRCPLAPERPQAPPPSSGGRCAHTHTLLQSVSRCLVSLPNFVCTRATLHTSPLDIAIRRPAQPSQEYQSSAGNCKTYGSQGWTNLVSFLFSTCSPFCWPELAAQVSWGFLQDRVIRW